MPYALPDGRTLPMDAPWTYEGIQYPANWLRLSTQLDRDRLGIVWEPDPEPYDQRFYWGPGLPKDHTQLVEQWVAQTKATAGSLLQPTDWQVIREADNGTAMTVDTKAKRQAIRDKSAEKVAAIEATTSTEELAAYITGPDYSQWLAASPAPAEDTLSFAGNSTTSGIT